MTLTQKYKIAAFTSHPIQYQVPLFRALSSHPLIDLTIYFFSDIGVSDVQLDLGGFGVPLKWDIPLLGGYRHVFLHNIASNKPNFFGFINPSIFRHMRRSRYDAIWIHGYASVSAWFVIFGAISRQIPLFMRGESHLLNSRPAMTRWIKKIILSNLFKQVTCCLPIGKLNAEYYRYYGVTDDQMFSVPYSVDNDFFQGKHRDLSKSRDELRKAEGIHADDIVVLFASKMMPRKRAKDLIMALHCLSNDKVVLFLVGDGEERTSLEQYVREHDLAKVRFYGFKNQTELPRFFTIADIFVLPSTDEPWGLIINEAMNFGLPIITTNQVGASPDLVANGVNGYVYQVGDVTALARHISALANDKVLRKKMGAMSLDIIGRWGYPEDIQGLLSALEYVRSKERVV